MKLSLSKFLRGVVQFVRTLLRDNAWQGSSLRAGFRAILLVSIFAWAPATYPGYWLALEGFVPVFNATHTSPLANIAITPDVWRGMGDATFLLIRPFILLGWEPTAAVRIGFILCFLLGGLGCYIWLEQRLGDRAAGLAGLLYIFSPILLATVYIRGSLSDAVIVALLPLALAGLSTYSQTGALSGAAIAVIAILWMWQTQAGLAALAMLLLLVYCLWVERNWMALLIVTVSALAGLTSLANVMQVTAPAPVLFQEHFVYGFQFFQQQWRNAPSIPGWQDDYPFQFGNAAIIYTILTFWGLFWYRRRNANGELPAVERLWFFCMGGIVLVVALVMPISAPLWQWSRADRLLIYPWQLLLLTLPLWAVTAGSLPAIHHLFRQIPVWVVLLAFVVLSSTPFLTTKFTEITPPPSPVAIFGEKNEIVLLSATLTENRQPRTSELAVVWQSLRPLSFDATLFFQALRPDQQTASDQTSTLTIVEQLDVQPIAPERPATTWQPGEIFTNTYQLDLTAVPSDTALIYYFGYYDWRDGTRLPVNLGIDDKLIIYGQ